jgi:hypothetical protein
MVTPRARDDFETFELQASSDGFGQFYFEKFIGFYYFDREIRQ